MIMNFNVEPSFISNVCIRPGMYLYNYDVNSFFSGGVDIGRIGRGA